jgi:hypothetical protein
VHSVCQRDAFNLIAKTVLTTPYKTRHMVRVWPHHMKSTSGLGENEADREGLPE